MHKSEPEATRPGLAPLTERERPDGAGAARPGLAPLAPLTAAGAGALTERERPGLAPLAPLTADGADGAPSRGDENLTGS